MSNLSRQTPSVSSCYYICRPVNTTYITFPSTLSYVLSHRTCIPLSLYFKLPPLLYFHSHIFLTDATILDKLEGWLHWISFKRPHNHWEIEFVFQLLPGNAQAVALQSVSIDTHTYQTCSFCTKATPKYHRNTTQSCDILICGVAKKRPTMLHWMILLNSLKVCLLNGPSHILYKKSIYFN